MSSLNERIRRLEVAMAKKAQGVDPLAWCLTRYRDAMDGMTPDELAAWHAFMTRGAGQPPTLPADVIAAGCMLEAYCPGVIDHLPDNWRDPAAMQQVLSSHPQRKRMPDPSTPDAEAEARAQPFIDRMVAELEAEHLSNKGRANELPEKTH